MSYFMGKLFRGTLAGAAIVAGIALLLTSCKEKGVVIDMGRGQRGVDTTYMGTIETPQSRVVLMEEYTGVSCPPCPKAHVVLANIKAKYGDRVAIMGIQVFGFQQAWPVVEKGDTLTVHDNRTQTGTDLSLEIYGKVSALPRSGIDRAVLDPQVNELYVQRDFWSNEVDKRMAVPTPANVAIESNYNSGTKMATIKVRVAYTAAVAKKQKLTLVITEDKVIDAQEVDTKIEEDYEHEHVLRDILTTSTGSAMLSNIGGIEPGRIYERTFVYDMSAHPLWNPDNCHLIAYVCNAEPTDKQVLQAAEVKLK